MLQQTQPIYNLRLNWTIFDNIFEQVKMNYDITNFYINMEILGNTYFNLFFAWMTEVY